MDLSNIQDGKPPAPRYRMATTCQAEHTFASPPFFFWAHIGNIAVLCNEQHAIDVPGLHANDVQLYLLSGDIRQSERERELLSGPLHGATTTLASRIVSTLLYSMYACDHQSAIHHPFRTSPIIKPRT